ncbi:MAG TPA: hypothetical protein VK866_04080 [Acidimicrobiales bacterium]|nr:hypothetical protein [Acidimicrobiales bacterium]
MDTTIARRMLRTLEPVHGMIYFVPEAAAAYAEVGLEGRAGYFASRAAAMGPVPAEVVVATFFNFHPDLVRTQIPDAWDRATPAQVLDARHRAVDAALRRLLGDAAHGPEIAEAAELAREATTALSPVGRPLYAGHASLPWPDEPHLVLWHAQTLLREHRGDGHVACLVTSGINDGCEALVTHAATEAVPADVLRTSRAWSIAEWDAAVTRLADRGWVHADGSFTDVGRRVRDEIEACTDQLSMAPWRLLGEERCARLRELVRPLSRAIVDGGGLVPTA